MSHMVEDARTKILLAAERLFAERGVEHVSMRQIGERAGQRNNSAVQYHFGDKSGLIQALYDLRLLPLNAERHRMIEEIDSSDPLQVAGAYVLPLARTVISSSGASCYARFLDRYLGRGRDFEPFDDRHGSGSREVVRQMATFLTTMGVDVREERLRMVQVLTIRTLADLEFRLETEQADTAAAELTVAALVEAVAALLQAPSSLRD